MLKAIFHKLLNSLDLEAPYTLWRTGYLRDYGWFDSYQLNQSVNAKHEPIPWYAYSAIDFLASRLTKTMEVFEYGCGNSTLWYAERVASVVSIEHDKNWFDLVSQKIPTNVQLLHRSLENHEYSAEITRHHRYFDLIVIDGRDRVNCVKHSVSYLKEEGVLILDNSDREKYESALRFMEETEYRRIDFAGIAPIFPNRTVTSIFYRGKNCLLI